MSSRCVVMYTATLSLDQAIGSISASQYTMFRIDAIVESSSYSSPRFINSRNTRAHRTSARRARCSRRRCSAIQTNKSRKDLSSLIKKNETGSYDSEEKIEEKQRLDRFRHNIVIVVDDRLDNSGQRRECEPEMLPSSACSVESQVPGSGVPSSLLSSFRCSYVS